MHRQHGFTLAELAIVLVIITILAAVLVVPIRGQIESRQRKQTEVALSRIEAALIGFAILNHRLPCPTTENDPAAADYGRENFVLDTSTDEWICDTSEEGKLPWRTLGLPAVDAWGRPRISATDSWDGYFRYRVDRGFSAKPRTGAAAPIKADTPYVNKIKVFDHADNEITVSSYTSADALKNTFALALVYSTGPNRTPNGENASYEPGIHAKYEYGEPTISTKAEPDTPYDDMVIWLARPLLIARMAQAGALD